MKVTEEKELKLDAPAGFVLPELGGTPLDRRVFSSTYYDTPEGSLAAAAITLRRRVENGSALWQLKLRTEEGRLELEHPGGPAAPPDELGSLLVAHTRASALAPVAELRTRRSGVLVDTGTASAEVVVDEVEVMDAMRVADSFVELEIELSAGDSGGLRSIAKRLRRSGARSTDGTPKLFRALGRSRPETQKGLRGWIATQTAAMLAADPGTRLGADPEALHDLRVAVRRLRATLRAPRPRPDELRAELEWLGDALAPVRDLDVMLEHLRGEIAALDGADRTDAAFVLSALERQRKAARRSMLAALASPRYLELLDGLEAYAPDEPGAKLLAKAAAKDFGKLRDAAGAASDDPDGETLHALRRLGKKARYSAELAGAQATLVKRAKRFQDVLGDHQDAVVIEERLRAVLGADPSPERALAVGRLIERERERREQARADWPKAWRELERAGRKAWT